MFRNLNTREELEAVRGVWTGERGYSRETPCGVSRKASTSYARAAKSDGRMTSRSNCERSLELEARCSRSCPTIQNSRLHRVPRCLQGVWRQRGARSRQLRRAAGGDRLHSGRSGVGKSVSLHHIMGFLKPDSDGDRRRPRHHRLHEEQLELIRKKVTMVFQNGALFDSLSVGENVAFRCANPGT